MKRIIKKLTAFDKISIVVQGLFSLLLSFSIFFNYEIKKGLEQYIFNFNFNIIFLLKTILLAIPIFFLFSYLIKLINKINITKDKKIDETKIVIFTFNGILITGIIFLISHYPAVSMNDTLAIIKSPIGTSIQHPLFYNVGISLIYRIFFKIFNSSCISFFITSILQLILIDIILTGMIYWYLKTFKNKLTTIILSLYFILIPIITNYNVALVKDSLFSIALLMQIPFLYEILKSKGEIFNNKKFILLFIIVFSLCVLLRNNGLYVMLFLLLIILIMYRKYYKKVLIIIISILVISMIPNKISSYLTKSELFQEKVGIPIQQIAYVIKVDGNISKNDRKYINSIMDIEEWKNNYNPYSVDTIKWHNKFNREKLNETKMKFISVWTKILMNNFENYVKSYLVATSHLWMIDDFNIDQSRFLGLPIEYEEAMKGYENLDNKRILPKTIHNMLNSFYEKTTKFFNNGTLLWIMLFLILYIIRSKKREYLLIIVPLLGVWLTLMISAPISYALRYFISYAYILPFAMLIIKNEIKKV